MSERDSSRPLPKIYVSFITKMRLEQRLLKLKLNGIFIDNETREALQKVEVTTAAVVVFFSPVFERRPTAVVTPRPPL